LTSGYRFDKIAALSPKQETKMENQAIDQAIDFFMGMIDNAKFETLYNEHVDNGNSDELREFIKTSLVNRKK
jgi:hypothetical protein